MITVMTMRRGVMAGVAFCAVAAGCGHGVSVTQARTARQEAVAQPATPPPTPADAPVTVPSPTVTTTSTTVSPTTTVPATTTTTKPRSTTTTTTILPSAATTPTTDGPGVGPTTGQTIPVNPPVWVVIDSHCSQTGQAEAAADHLQQIPASECDDGQYIPPTTTTVPQPVIMSTSVVDPKSGQTIDFCYLFPSRDAVKYWNGPGQIVTACPSGLEEITYPDGQVVRPAA